MRTDDVSVMRLNNPTSKRTGSMARGTALALGAALLLGGCDTVSSLNPFDRPEVYKPEVKEIVPADRLYNEGLARLQNGDSEGAAKKFDQIDKEAPFSPYARKGLILAAYTNYQASKWEETITASKRFIAQNPASPDAAYAQYLMAMSYYNQIPDATRDQERTQLAIAAFEQLIQRYPKSEYVLDAKEKLLVARDQLPHAVAELSTHENQRVTKALNDGLQAALTGTKPPKKALEDAQAEAERILKPYR